MRTDNAEYACDSAVVVSSCYCPRAGGTELDCVEMGAADVSGERSGV